MSSLTDSLEKRIQNLKSSIHSQEAELAAYEQVLKIERGATPGEPRQPEVSHAVRKKAQPIHVDKPAAETSIAPATGTDTDPAFSGSKIGYVAQILEARGTTGATPKEIDQVFSAKRISRSDNLVYNALSLLRKDRKLEKRDGRYYFLPSPSAPAKKAAAPQKRRISPEGLKRIIDANKKRWAEKRAAQNGGSGSTAKKSAHRATKGTAKAKR
jgi:hypothetical protein